MKKNIKIKIIFALLSSFITVNEASGSSKIRKTGDYVQISVPIIALASTIFHQDRQGGEQLALSLYTTQVSVYAFKHVFPVARQLNPNNMQSSISGHTAIPMASSAYLMQRYGWEYALPAYMLTAFVGYSRVSSRAHRLNEVIGGAVLGQVISYIITTSFKDKQVNLVAGPGNIGVNITF